MQQTSNTYKSILLSQNHSVEWKISVNGVDYAENDIVASSGGGHAMPQIERQLFSENSASVGGCTAATISFSLFATSNSIPRMAEIKPFCRLVNSNSESEWLQKGVYYIDTRKTDAATGIIAITGYDAMLKAEQPMIPQGETSDTWPKSCTTVMGIIATAMGVELDSRTSLNAEYLVGFPSTDMTMRQVMGYIGAMHGGNWCMSDNGKLRLVPLIPPSTPTVDIGTAMKSIDFAPPFSAWSGVRFVYDDTVVAFYGSESGRVLEAECPWATQVMAQTVYSQIAGEIYQPFTARNAIFDPSAELGDKISTQGYSSVLASQVLTFGPLCASDISAPSDDEIDHEYPYIAPVPKSTQRAINKTRAAITVDLNSIRADVEDVETQAHSELLQLADSIQLSVSQATSGGGETYASITLRVGEDTYTGQILLEGNVDVSGQLSADALYAAMGDIADLQVNRLSTSRRIVKYLAGDTSDDNYIHASGEALQFVSGVCTNISEIARNGNDLPIYWESDPNGEGVVIGTDGYPYKNGIRIYTTTTQTAYPVLVYVYDELVKAKINFESDGTDYIPVLTMGAGDTYGNNKMRLKKSRDGLSLIYTATDGKEIGLLGSADGYLDPVGLRRITGLDFSEWEHGAFTITSEGGVELEYGVAFNNDGVPILITGPHSSVAVTM